jgi:hypothetical protein
VARRRDGGSHSGRGGLGLRLRGVDGNGQWFYTALTVW